jgi:F-type H+-transporting ATPase subunit a
MRLLAVEAPSTHETIQVCHSTFCILNYQTLISSGIAILITVALALLVAGRLRRGTPGKLQMVLELFLDYVKGLVGDTVGDEEAARFIIPIAATIGFYILVANWLDFFPLQKPVEPATSDINQTAAMGIFVILVVQAYSIRVLGLRGYLRRFTKPFEMNLFVRALFVPLNIIEELVKPVTLSLRLFGNIFAGVVMVFLLGQLFGAGSAVITHVAFGIFGVVLLVAWKFFDVFFVGTIQAFIFMLLTVIYFGMAREGLEEEPHRATSEPASAHA